MIEEDNHSSELTESLRCVVPLEIMQEIFRHGSSMSTGMAYNLCLVCSWARDVALPRLYAFFDLNTEDEYARFVGAVEQQQLISCSGLVFRPREAVLAIKIGKWPTKHLSKAVFALSEHNLTNLAIGSTAFIVLITNVLRDDELVARLEKRIAKRGYGLDLFLTSTRNTSSVDGLLLHRKNLFGGFCTKISRLRLLVPNPHTNEQSQFPDHTTIYTELFTSLTHIALVFTSKEQDGRSVTKLLKHPTLEVILLLVSEDIFTEWKQDLKAKDGWWARAQVEAIKQSRQRMITIRIVKFDARKIYVDWEREMRGSGKSIWDIEG